MKELRFTQIQCVPVPNVGSTQCNVYIYGLDELGQLWFKRDQDESWTNEPMEAYGTSLDVEETNECIRKARGIFKRQEEQDDPYAMHRAIESIPPDVLRNIIKFGVC